MIRFSLRCDNAHEFESWFKDGAAFDRMAAAGLVDCPVCGDTKVSKALMAPAIRKTPGVKGRAAVAPAPAEVPKPAADDQTPRLAAGPMPAQVVALLQRMRQEIEANCENMGKDFAKEARRIHEGEAEARGIYGEATEAEAEALREEGIEVARLPWVPRADG
ncbi:DUF1178 family protein [Roseococcus sp. SDR]|uniref:DUF1178 family protein n=1 Tax=Roseococcus sp. SDR TaxID=2835532 RepID=UPI001BD10FA8|nr:DUF1178 family protein [Roseococcus sp. SDR]MBS7788414.1 DUF1178 family protein [Roseococcus sp. SDR]MBV1843728.1 DUF1178 family protein [Roseococcus sp. SDR]